MYDKKTVEYDKFLNIIGNRLVNQAHLHKLMKEIERRDLLEVCPMIVNESMEVIDGQHRLEAPKRLQRAIYYVIVPGLGIKDVIRMNTHQKPWKVWDYIELHIQYGNENYQILKDFSLQWKLPASSSTLLLSGSGWQTTNRGRFQEG